MTDERSTCCAADAGLDLHALHAEFECWVAEDLQRTPADWQRAFIGWGWRYREKHKHQLRG